MISRPNVIFRLSKTRFYATAKHPASAALTLWTEKIAPVIDRSYRLSEVPEAIRYKDTLAERWS